MPTLKLLSKQTETPEMQLLTFEKPAGFSYHSGQYVVLEIAGREDKGYFAIASHHSEPELKFLIKGDGDFAKALISLEVNNEVTCSEAQGKGFALEQLKGHNVLIITHGSGISAMRGLAFDIAGARSDYKEVSLFYGSREVPQIPFASDFKSWQEQINCYHALSKALDNADHLQATQGWVQILLEKHIDNASGYRVCLVGSKEMSQEVTALLEKKGVTKENIFSNF